MLLYLFHSAHCLACKSALSELAVARTKRFDFTPVFRQVDGLHTTEGQDAIAGFTPKMTPAYVVVSGGMIIAKHEGVLRSPVLLKWLDECAQSINNVHRASLAGSKPPAPPRPGGSAAGRTARGPAPAVKRVAGGAVAVAARAPVKPVEPIRRRK